MHGGYAEEWEVALIDIQGKMSSLYFWPSTMTCACIKFQVYRGDVLEHEELTPFFNVSQYQLKCNFKFSMNVPTDCTQIRLALISGDVNQVSGKPKLVARSRVSFAEIRRRCPLHKYFSLYRWDPVTESNVLGGHMRIAIRCNQTSDCFDEEFMEFRSSSSVDRISVCSSARGEGFALMRTCDSDINTLPPRPASAIPRVVFSSGATANHSSSSAYSDVETAESTRTRTDRSRYSSTFRREVFRPVQHPRARSFDSHAARRNSRTEENRSSLHQHCESVEEGYVYSKVSEESGSECEHHSMRASHHKVVWFGIIVGTTLTLLGTVAAFTLRCLSRRKCDKRRTGDIMLSSKAY